MIEFKAVGFRKSGTNWIADYLGTDGVYHYVADAKTKDMLIKKLIQMVLRQELP